MPTLKDQLILHEKLKLKVYKDSLGIETIGVGRNIRDKGITKLTAMQMLDEDILESESDLAGFSWYNALDPIRKRVLIDMRFNLGPSRFRKFKQMLAHVANHDFDKAADEMMNSLWAKQTKTRAIRLAKMMRDGNDYTN